MSEQSIGVLTLTAVAPANVTQYQAVGFDGAAIAADNARIKGFAETAATAGRAYAVRVLGTGTALAGAAITKGTALRTDTTGALVPAIAGETVVADALEDAAQGQPFEVLIAR